MCVHQYQKMNEVCYTKERELGGSHRTVEHSRGGGKSGDEFVVEEIYQGEVSLKNTAITIVAL